MPWVSKVVPLLAAGLLVASCADPGSERPSAREKWDRAQLVFPALSIDAATNQWTSPDHLVEKYGFICWADWWPDRIPTWLSAPELAATAVIACPPLNDERTAAAIARIASVDRAEAAKLLQQARDALSQ